MLKDRRNSRRILNQVQQTLTQKYRSLQMKGLPWMDELVLSLDQFFVETSLVAMDKRGRDLPLETIQLQELFQAQTGGTAPSRILIEGGPGYGKSTLAAKLAFDWAQREAYIKHFNLVILLPLRHFNGDLLHLLATASEVKEKHKEHYLEILNKKSRRILLIFDGYDEIPPDREEHLLPLFEKKIFPHVTMVITSRVGEFISNKQETASRMSIWGDADIGPTFCHFIDKRVSLEGMNPRRQDEFFKKHVASYSQQVVTNLKSKLKSLVDTDFLKCPLFFLMFLVIFRNETTVQHVLTKSDLYKQIFNFVFRRYLKKQNELPTVDVDLFTLRRDEGNTSGCIQLMIEFGNFAKEVLQQDKLSFSREEIVGHKRDPRIMALGLLTKIVSVHGITEVVTYEPVHRSLLEFAAAYSLWTEYSYVESSEWKEQICSLRPTDSSSLFFPFLTGLMGENANLLFQTLTPFAVEYSNNFTVLESSLLEVSITSSILDAILPFLPVHWKIKSYYDVHGFSKSQQHETIVKGGLKSGKIRLIKCPHQCVLLPLYAFPYDEQIETMRLVISDRLVEPSKFPREYYSGKKFKCKHVRCIFHNISGCYKDAVIWEAFLKYLDCFEFQDISFHLSSSVSKCLYRLCVHAENLKLRNFNIHRVSCDVKEEPNLVVKWLNYLIKKDLVQSVDLLIYTELLQEPYRSLSQRRMSQDELNVLLASASHSVKLSQFSIKTVEKDNDLTVDLDQLCDSGNKSWESLELSNINVCCKAEISHSFSIRNLLLSSVEFLDPPTNFFQSCQIASLSCNSSLVAAAVTHDTPLLQSVSELNIQLCEFSDMNPYKNLQILSLNLASLPDESHPKPMHELLLGPRHYLWLTGLELWGVETKFSLASKFVHGVVNYLTGRKTLSERHQVRQDASSPMNSDNSTHRNKRKLQLLYFTLATGTPENVRDDDAGNDDKYDHFLSLVAQMKQPLTDNYLPRFNVICHDHFFENVLRFNNQNITSWLQLFSPEEGFNMKYELHGARVQDPTWSQIEHEKALTNRLNKLSISFSNE